MKKNTCSEPAVARGVPRQLRVRAAACAGCIFNIYNGEQNHCGPHCWNLTNDDNFRTKRPRCYIEGGV